MSLHSLRQHRLQGSVPAGVVKVVVGKRLPAINARPDVIAVDAPDQPALMDWRPVVGLPLALFVCRGADPLAERVLDALMPAGCRLLGSAWHDAIESTDEAIKPVLHRMWEALCL